MTEAETLEVWMARLAEGDRSAFTPVFEALWEPMLRFCRASLHNEADAADAAQQSMEKVLMRASQYDPSRPALPWAFAIASWECRTFQQKRRRRKETPEDAAAEPRAGDVEADVAERELIAAAMAAMGTLSDADREALIATYWEQDTNVGGATFRKRRERALTRLRAAFRRLYGLD